MTNQQPTSISTSPLAGCLGNPQVDRENRSGWALLRCPAGFPGFDGHFPGQPVLPAVLQLLAVRLLAGAVAEAELFPVAVERLKFKGMIAPDDQIEVRVKLRDQDGLFRGEFRLTRGGAPVASGALIFKQAGGEG